MARWTARDAICAPVVAFTTPGGECGRPETGAGTTLGDVFADVAEAATRCRFRDCAHEREAGCAVRAEVDAGRYERWRALRAELAYLDRRDDPAALAHEKRRWKSIAKAQRSHDR